MADGGHVPVEGDNAKAVAPISPDNELLAGPNLWETMPKEILEDMGLEVPRNAYQEARNRTPEWSQAAILLEAHAGRFPKTRFSPK